MLACLDLEGVLLPEIWIKFAEKVEIRSIKISFIARSIKSQGRLLLG